jgi:hypothetical protein
VENELAVVFSSQVAKLAGRSKRAGQVFTKSSQILSFVKGLHEGFADISKDCFSGRLSIADATLRDTAALAKTLKLLMDKTTIAPWTQERAAAAMPDAPTAPLPTTRRSMLAQGR